MVLTMKRTQQKNKCIVLGVSACLLGENVRYDGNHKRHGVVCGLRKTFELLAVCPEVAAGLGVPRPAVQLVDVEGGIKALGVKDRNLDITRRLAKRSASLVTELAHISGFVFKSRSPSCGDGSSPVHNERGEVAGFDQGLFAQVLSRHLPRLPMIEERQLEDARRRADFIQEVEAYFFRLD